MFAINDLKLLNERLENLHYWEIAQDSYRIVTAPGIWSELSMYYDLYDRKVAFYHYLTLNHNAFIIDTGNIHMLANPWFEPYTDMESAPSMEISPNGYRINISPGFLDLNPISAINGIDIQEQLIWDYNVLNLLVPEHLQPYEQEIVMLYREDFFFHQVGIQNIYNREFNLDENETEIDTLQINVIYVNSGQSYFSFNKWLLPDQGHAVIDPIAVIYTGNIHPSTLGAWTSTSLYFQTDSLDPYTEILPLLLELGLESTIQQVENVYDRNISFIRMFQDHQRNLIIFIISLIFAKLIVAYNLIANYFEINKYKLTIKRNFGFHVLKRNQNFIITFLTYNLFILFAMNLMLGWKVLIIGTMSLILDLFVISIFEYNLINKSFSEIMKGEL